MMKYIIAAILSLAITPAFATYNGNPYIPDNIPVVQEADIVHVGDSKYCSVHPALYSCEGLDLVNGESPNKAGLPSREGKHVVHEAPSKPDCEGPADVN